ncbi:MAG: AraC family transcriptional regulator [Desulfobacterium sp.]|nr:AraC family transcriptional regulator [Desulfobacterium sp.]
MEPLNTGKRNDYQGRINRVIDHIESNLDKEFSLGELASIACFSKFHFHRIFNALVNETLFGFIQRVRVEKAATLLVANHHTPVTDIALDCGFTSSSAFARAFKARFNMTATQWRKRKQSVYGRAGRKETAGAPESLGKRFLTRDVRIRELESQPLAYVRYIGPYEGNAALFESLFSRLYQWANPRDLITDKTQCLAVYHDSIDITALDKLRVSACITVPPGTRVAGEVGKMRLSKGKYASARFKLGPSDYYEAWNWLFSQWLPSSGYAPDDGPRFERYPPMELEEKEDGKMTVDICIPVTPL